MNYLKRYYDKIIKKLKYNKVTILTCIGLSFVMVIPLFATPISEDSLTLYENTTNNTIEDTTLFSDDDLIISVYESSLEIVKAPLLQSSKKEFETLLKETSNDVVDETSKELNEVPFKQNENSSKPKDEIDKVEEFTTTPQIEHITNENVLSEIDRQLLLRIASCEAGNQGVVGMAYVIKVVLNRVESDEFPNNIHDVIYAKKQFAAIHSHWWSDGYIAEGAEEALELVYSGWDETEGALYFCMPCSNGYHSSSLEYIKTYKDHEFYK